MQADWKYVHQQLRGIAQRRGELDAREATYLVEAEQRRLWTHVGCISMLDYMERELGYAPREAVERLRLARRLEHLPELHARLADGTFKLTALRELARVATPDTEDVWIEAARGKTLRQIEQLVTGRKPGDTPDDEPGPDLEPRDVTFSLTPSAIALLRQARVHLAGERGSTTLTDSELFETLVRRALEPVADPATGVTPPAYTMAITTCRQCKRGWQHGGGREIEVDAVTLAMAHCDNEHLGSLEAATPARKKSRISKRKRQHVFMRDHHRCVVPGCRSSRNLDVHHLQFQVNGGGHALWNISVLCTGHHRLLHAGFLVITGRAPDQLTFAYPGRSVSSEATAMNVVEPGSTTPGSGPAPCSFVPTGGDTHDTHDRRAAVIARAASSVASSSSGSAPCSLVPTAADTHDRRVAIIAGGASSLASSSSRGERTSRAERSASNASSAHGNTMLRRPGMVHGPRPPFEPTEPVGSPPTIAIPGDAVTALVGLGFKPAETRRALEIARTHVGQEPTLEIWIREGLRACARAQRMEDGASPVSARCTRRAPP